MDRSMDQLQQSIALQKVLEHKINRIFYNEELTLKLAKTLQRKGPAARKLEKIEKLISIIEICIVNEQYRRAMRMLVALDIVEKDLIENL
jgi:SPX domain protein involved in polyphosphate accumulation